MKIKLDENLPYRLVSFLTELGHDADTRCSTSAWPDMTTTSCGKLPKATGAS